MSLDVLAILATIIVALITAYYRRKGSLDTVVNEQLKLLLKYKDQEIETLRKENTAMKAIIDSVNLDTNKNADKDNK
jgi:hypothetical protein